MQKNSTSNIMASVSGLRGVIGESILPEVYIQYILAYGSELCGGTVIVGSDTRPSGEYIRYLVYSALFATGCNVIDIGIVPTPTVGMMIKELNVQGGIAISASHNPEEWNAVKFFSGEGKIISQNQFQDILRRVEKKDFNLAHYKNLGSLKKYQHACQIHVENVIKHVSREAIHNSKFKVAVDLCNGAACFIAPYLFDKLQCSTWYCYEKPTGIFEREPEPLAKNLERLSSLVRKHHADVGFAFDPDADRLAIIDENGHCIGEERSTVLAAYHVLKNKHLSPLVVNLSTTMAINDLASLFSVPVYRTPIGEANVLTGMEKHDAFLGGEGNGGVIYGPMHFGRDATSGIALILELMSRENMPVSKINSIVPTYPLSKEKISFRPEHFSILKKKLIHRFSREQINLEDGIKISFARGWVHLRPSGTEPIIRMYSEAQNKSDLDQYRAVIHELLQEG